MSLNSVQSFVIENCNGPTIENGLNNVCLHPLYRTFTFLYRVAAASKSSSSLCSLSQSVEFNVQYNLKITSIIHFLLISHCLYPVRILSLGLKQFTALILYHV